MQLSVFKKKFNDTLKEDFPQGEILSLFNWLTEAYLGMTRLQLALSPERELSPSEAAEFEEALRRIQNYEPIQYIIGKTEFFGLTFGVDPNVLIPRPETEELVEWILEDVKQMKHKELRILDIGTGSGCIAISLAKNLPEARLMGIDVSEEALRLAKQNAQRNEVAVEFKQMDILTINSFEEKFDVIVSNPPYVREMEREQMSANVIENEPGLALWVTNEDPLLFYRKITKLAKDALNPEGMLYFEINEAFGEETKELLVNNNFQASLKKDIFGKDRMLKGYSAT